MRQIEYLSIMTQLLREIDEETPAEYSRALRTQGLL